MWKLKSGESLVIERRDANEIVIEELFRYTAPFGDSGKGIEVEIKDIKIGYGETGILPRV